MYGWGIVGRSEQICVDLASSREEINVNMMKLLPSHQNLWVFFILSFLSFFFFWFFFIIIFWVHGKLFQSTIDEQLHLVILFVPSQGDQFNYFLFKPSPCSQEDWWGCFPIFFCARPYLFGTWIWVFLVNNIFIHQRF